MYLNSCFQQKVIIKLKQKCNSIKILLIYLVLKISRRVQFIYQKKITFENHTELLFIGNERIMFASKTLIDLFNLNHREFSLEINGK